MNTIITKEIDGLTVVLGLDKEKIDSVSTMKKIKPIIEGTKEFTAQKTRLEKIRGLNVSNDSLDRQVKAIANRAALRVGKLPGEVTNDDLNESEVSQVNKFSQRRQNNIDERSKIESVLPEVDEKLKAKIKKITTENAIYFPLNKENEEIISDTEASQIKEKLKDLKKGQFLLTDGTIIEDLRNKTYYGLIDGKWDKKEVKALNEVVDIGIYILSADLTDEERKEIAVQEEADRIAGMSAEDKADELAMVKENLISQAVNMRSKLEIQGDADALVKSQDWLKAENNKAEEKYA